MQRLNSNCAAQALLGAALLAVSIGACAGTRRPVLYPNDAYQRVGSATAQQHIDECMRRAEAYLESGAGDAAVAQDVATKTAVGAGTGAAIGAAGGAVSGDAGHGAAVGAATGATAGFLGGIIGAIGRKSEPDPTYARFVERCLREKGYEPIGWE